MSEIPIEPEPDLSPIRLYNLTKPETVNQTARYYLFNSKGTHEYR
jgi:hypothetical protein